MSDLLFNAKFTSNDQLELGGTVDFADVSQIQITLGSEIRNDSMVVHLKNPPVDVFSDGSIRHRWVDTDGNPIFRAVKAAPGDIIEDELIDVSAFYTDTDPTIDVDSDTYRLFTGIIDKAKVSHDDRSHKIQLPCVNRNSVALNKIAVPQAFDLDDAKNSPEMQQQILRRAASGYAGNAITFDQDGVSGVNLVYTIDARLFSEGIVATGSTTSASTRKLVDSGATFTATVDEGDWVRNSVTEQYAYVVSVDGDTELTLTKDIMGSGDTYQISDGFIQDTRPDGSVFPDIAFSFYNTPIAQNLDDLSQTDKTNTQAEIDTSIVVTRRARYFIDIKNRYHWYIPDETPELLMEVGVNTPIAPDVRRHIIFKQELTNDIVEEVNFIVYKAGEDMNNIQIMDGLRAPFSGRPQVKDSFRDFSEIARAMKLEDVRVGNISQVMSDEFDYPASYNPLPSGDSYPAWDNIKSSVPLNDDDYNDAFIAEAIRRANDRCRAIFNNQSNPRWKGTITVRGENFQRGDLINFTDRSHGIRNILVRVVGVSHTITALTGWVTQISVEQDEPEQQV